MDSIKQIIEKSVDLKRGILEDEELLARIEEAASQLIECFRSGGRVFLCGNGGSAADAQHVSAELSGRFRYDREPLPAEALHANTSYVTAVANDYGFEEVYARLLKGQGRSGDVLVGFSTSGNSPNMVKAFEAAREAGIKAVALTGSSGGELKPLADILINVPCDDTPRIQEAHIMIAHIICEIVEAEMFPANKHG